MLKHMILMTMSMSVFGAASIAVAGGVPITIFGHTLSVPINDQTGTGPGISCTQPNSFSARSDPLSCTNHYEFSGYCTQGAEGHGGNPETTVEAGRAVYTVTADWNGYSQEAVQTFSVSGTYSGYKGTTVYKGKVVSHCPDDPWINSVSCKSGAVSWSGPYAQADEDVMKKSVSNVFPIMSGGTHRSALRKQLLANSKGPQILSPKEYEKLNNPKQVLVTFQAALPCGIGNGSTAAVLMIQKEKDITTKKAKGFVNVTWVDAGTRKVKIRNNGGIVSLSNLTAGTWRIKARVVSPHFGTPSLWRTFSVKRLIRISLPSQLPIKSVLPAKPPIVQIPKQNRIFINQVEILVRRPLKHTDYSRWKYVFEWKRAKYNTAANNAYAYQIWKQKKHAYSYFPPVLGLATALRPWLPPTRLRTMLSIEMENPSHIYYSLRSKRLDSSYLYQFRVREYSQVGNAYGPWSAWRSFIVQGRMPPPTMYHISPKPLKLLMPGSAKNKQQSGHQQSRRFAPMVPIHPLNQPVRRLPKSKPAAGLQRGMQQRGVRMKLSPRIKLTPQKKLAPVRRLAPAAPVRQMNLPTQLRLNR